MTVDICLTRFRRLPRGPTARSAVAVDRNKQAPTLRGGVTESFGSIEATFATHTIATSTHVREEW